MPLLVGSYKFSSYNIGHWRTCTPLPRYLAKKILHKEKDNYQQLKQVKTMKDSEISYKYLFLYKNWEAVKL